MPLDEFAAHPTWASLSTLTPQTMNPTDLFADLPHTADIAIVAASTVWFVAVTLIARRANR